MPSTSTLIVTAHLWVFPHLYPSFGLLQQYTYGESHSGGWELQLILEVFILHFWTFLLPCLAWWNQGQLFGIILACIKQSCLSVSSSEMPSVSIFLGQYLRVVCTYQAFSWNVIQKKLLNITFYCRGIQVHNKLERKKITFFWYEFLNLFILKCNF